MPEVTLLRQLDAEDVKCPAGTLTGDASVRCNIEEHTLNGHIEPTSVEGLCCGAYETCATWLAMKKVEDKGGDFRKILGSMQDRSRELKMRAALRDARVARAQRLMVEDSDEGRKFRKHLAIGEFDTAAEVARG